jgi:hypothetical protein
MSARTAGWVSSSTDAKSPTLSIVRHCYWHLELSAALCEQLVAEGRTEDVLRYLASLEAGFAG